MGGKSAFLPGEACRGSPRPEGRVDTTGVSRGRTSRPDIRPVKDRTSGKAMEVGGL